MKTYFTLIAKTQTTMLWISILILMILPQLIVFYPDTIFPHHTVLYAVAHFTLFFVMIIRPLADLLPRIKFIRPLVILRKGLGVFSASLVLSFSLAKLMVDPAGYFSQFTTATYWSLDKLALFAHLADISAILLIITSNQLSKQLLGKNWKRLQRLSYVYFYGSASYVFFILNDTKALVYLSVVSVVTLAAFIVNQRRRSGAVSRARYAVSN